MIVVVVDAGVARGILRCWFNYLHDLVIAITMRSDYRLFRFYKTNYMVGADMVGAARKRGASKMLTLAY